MKVFLSFLFTTLFVFSTFSIANVQSHSNVQNKVNTVQQDSIYQYFELAGINRLLASVPEQVRAMQQDVIAEQGEMSADNKILSTLVAAWQQQEIRQSLADSLVKSLNEKQLSELINWQNSALAKLIKQRDELTNKASFEQSFIAFVETLPHSLPNENKQQLINELIDAKHMVDSMVELTLAVSRPVLLAMLQSPAAEKEGLTVQSVEQQLFELEQLLKPELELQISLVSYFLYQDVEDSKIQQTVEFYHSDIGQLELAILNKALYQSIAIWQARYEEKSLLRELSPLAMLRD